MTLKLFTYFGELYSNQNAKDCKKVSTKQSPSPIIKIILNEAYNKIASKTTDNKY